jgi:hypothetical protein
LLFSKVNGKEEKWHVNLTLLCLKVNCSWECWWNGKRFLLKHANRDIRFVIISTFKLCIILILFHSQEQVLSTRCVFGSGSILSWVASNTSLQRSNSIGLCCEDVWLLVENAICHPKLILTLKYLILSLLLGWKIDREICEVPTIVPFSEQNAPQMTWFTTKRPFLSSIWGRVRCYYLHPFCSVLNPAVLFQINYTYVITGCYFSCTLL